MRGVPKADIKAAYPRHYFKAGASLRKLRTRIFAGQGAAIVVRYGKLLSLMSALPPKADIAERHWDVRFVPKADITTAGTGVYLHRQKIAEAHTMFAE